MTEPHTIRLPSQIWEAFKLLHQREGTPQSQYETLNAAAANLFIYHVAFHQREHHLTGALAGMRGRDRDLVYDFLLFAVQAGLNVGDLLPKPADASSLLALARRCRHGEGFTALPAE